MRVLAFSPYAAWKFHSNYETTILRACQIRGAEIKVVLCDAVFNECDMYNPNHQSRPLDICQHCQFNAKTVLDETGLPYEWFSKYLSSEEQQEAFNWAQNIHREEFPSANFRGFPVGDWVTGSVVSAFRVYPVPLDNWHTINVFRGFLHAAALACIGLEHIFEQWRPDAMLLFNGRRSITRVAFNLARLHGIRILVHERPQRLGTILILENEICTSTVPFKNFWQKWQEVPLTTLQLKTVVRWLQSRRYGLSPGDFRFTASPQGDEKGKVASGKQTGRKLIVLFTSSTDEFAGDSTMQTPFMSQEDWIRRIIDWAKLHLEYDFVIRAHPALTGKSGNFGGRAAVQIRWLEGLQTEFSSNIRLISPDSLVSSYDLMDNADLGLIYGSTTGLEMMALGKPIGLVPGFTLYESVPGVVLFKSPDDVNEVMDYAITLKPSLEYQRYAFRCIYRYFYHFLLPFSLVSMKNLEETELRYKSDKELRLGADATLDQICAFLMENKPIYVAPNADEPQHKNEDQFLKGLGDSLLWLNNEQVRYKARYYENLRLARRILRKVGRVRHVHRRVLKFIKTPD